MGCTRAAATLPASGQPCYQDLAQHVTNACSLESTLLCTLLHRMQEPLRPTSPAVDDALRAAEALLDSIKQGGGEPSMSSSNLGYTDFGYACDENGCVLVVQQDSTNTTGGVAE